MKENENLQQQKSNCLSNLLRVLNENINISKLTKLGTNYILKVLKSTLQSKFRDGWRENLFNDERTQFGNKLRTYRMFKNSFNPESYLFLIDDKTTRSALSVRRP